jgi:hypothetical protein
MHKILALSALACACVSVNATTLHVDFTQDNWTAAIGLYAVDLNFREVADFYVDGALVGKNAIAVNWTGLPDDYLTNPFFSPGEHFATMQVVRNGETITFEGDTSWTVAAPIGERPPPPPRVSVPDGGPTSAMAVIVLAGLALARKRIR